VNTTDPETGKPAKRETNTMPQWAGSCWYYLRYIDPDYKKGPVNKEKEDYWLPVDLYVGGAEHAVLHLLYARFWHKVLYDCGVVSTKEPFQRLVNQGMILGEMEYTAYKDDNGNYVSVNDNNIQNLTPEKLNEDQVEKKGEDFVFKGTNIVVDARSFKMSKSRGNVINPDDVVNEYGADALRLYEMFMGPLEQVKPWSMQGVEGVYRFLKRIWRMLIDEDTGNLNKDVKAIDPARDHLKLLHQTIKKVTDDIDELKFNTAIAALMIFNNEAMKWETKPVRIMKEFVLLLSPFAPHMAEELWLKLGNDDTLAYTDWPEYKKEYLVSDTARYAVQVNGKVRGEIDVERDKATDKDYVLGLAKSEEGVARYLEEGQIVREIFVPNKIINFVVK
jgi:leucyl-tRNA synthetase